MFTFATKIKFTYASSKGFIFSFCWFQKFSIFFSILANFRIYNKEKNCFPEFSKNIYHNILKIHQKQIAAFNLCMKLKVL
jgi:hypothetical protein